MTSVSYTLTDQNNDGDIDRFSGDSINGIDIVNSWPGDTVKVTLPDGSAVTYVGTTFYLQDGGRVFAPTDGQVLKVATLNSSTYVNTQGPLLVGSLGPPCFVAGTLIDTHEGPRAVEDLDVGDLVMTLDNGPQEVRWTGCRVVAGQGDFAPIRFAPNALRNEVELLVSPQHRMLITGWRAELLFGEDEVLVAAKHLVNGDMIHVMSTREVSYHHLLFDQHEIVFSNGIPSESFHPGETILDGDADLRAELSTLFPELSDMGSGWDRRCARHVIKGKEARVLCGM
ncbi:MAG: Hint domain-containing protein [Yoonia sp.]|nr:Hint domain-containing protein [Yoonia sp.]